MGMKLTDFIFLRLQDDKLDEDLARRSAFGFDKSLRIAAAQDIQEFIAEARKQRRRVLVMSFSSMPVGERRMLEAGVVHNVFTLL